MIYVKDITIDYRRLLSISYIHAIRRVQALGNCLGRAIALFASIFCLCRADESPDFLNIFFQ